MSTTPPDPDGRLPADMDHVPASSTSGAPPSVVAAVKLMYVGAGLSLLGMLFGLTTRDVMRDQVIEDNPDMTSGEIDRAVNVATGVGVIIGLIAVGLWLWMARANGRGLAWARIVATVLFGLNVVLSLYNVSQTRGFGVVVSIVSIVLAGAILWLLYRRDATEYYGAVAARGVS
ncbi:MAG TPA: hypothetical protein VJ644_03160 [Jiangellaceae bacterium]|nr:hypothetical protein [Jiangellaceae bacterium]